MLQYLLNATAIWLISLVLFDIFLRRESYHGYNRFYLLLTFLLGALLPLWQWQDDGAIYNAALQRPVERVISAKETIVAAAPSSASWNWEMYLGYVYLAGVLVTLLLLMAEVVRIARLYRAGNRYREGSCVIVETGKDYSPFSLFNLVFVSKRDRYTQEEWDTIIAHEQMHGLLLHFLDVLLMQVAKIVFWFHPLVYVYRKRLMMQHEYQADKTGTTKPQFYGKFLIEQALLQTAPSISHSFNRSPIKNRIVMLTRKSTAAARTKMLVFVPLALVCIVCFSKNSFSQKFERKGNIARYNGNSFEMSKDGIDTFTLIDPVSGKELTKMTHKYPAPIKMNGKTIPVLPDQEPYYTGTDKDLRAYLLKNLKSEFSGLKDGVYDFQINNIVVDEHGKIVYFDYQNMKRDRTEERMPHNANKPKPSTTMPPDMVVTINDTSFHGDRVMGLYRNTDPMNFEVLDKEKQKAVFDKVCRLMSNAPVFKPATLNGKKVVSVYATTPFWNSFKLAGSKIYDLSETGEWKEL